MIPPMIPSLSFRRIFVLGLALAGVVLVARGDGDAFSHRLDPSVLESAKMGPNASLYFRREIPVLIRSDQAVNILNLSSATANILMLGKYNNPGGSLDLELHGSLRMARSRSISLWDASTRPFMSGRELSARSKELESLGASLRRG